MLTQFTRDDHEHGHTPYASPMRRVEWFPFVVENCELVARISAWLN